MSDEQQPGDPRKDTLKGLSHRFSNPGLLQQALTHRSHSKPDNERLEFLGDAILNMVVADLIFRHYPELPEGDLSRMRARVVRGETLADIARELNLGDQLRLGEGELRAGGFRRDSILADALEAVVGAIYLDAGFAAAQLAVTSLCQARVENLPDPESLKDAKTRLQEHLQAGGQPLPVYRLLAEAGEDHAKRFTVACEIQGFGPTDFVAEERSRRRAEKSAAALALAALGAHSNKVSA